MPETPDPVAALTAPDVPTRAAACRDLSSGGDLGHLERLVEVASRDPSPAVRLGAAAAAADILSRHRLPPARDRLSAGARASLLQAVSRTEPGASPALLQVVGELRVPGAFQRLRMALRDPRVDVRVGACVGLLRLCASAAANGDSGLEEQVVALLSDARIRPESRAELARLCANVGFARALEPARTLAERVERAAAEAVADALRRLEAGGCVDGSSAALPVRGVWVDRGLDPLARIADPPVDHRARGPTGAQPAFLAVTGASSSPGDALLLEGGTLTGGPLVGPVRRLFLPPGPGEPPVAALQVGERTWWESGVDEAAAFSDALIAAGGVAVAASILPLLPEGAATERLRGAVLVHEGRHAEAVEVLTAATSLRKVPPDLWWWLAEALDGLGRHAEARQALERFVQKSPRARAAAHGSAIRGAPDVDEARARLGADPPRTT